MMEGTQDGNLPSGVTVNNTYVHLLNQVGSPCVCKTQMNTTCGSANLCMLVIYGSVEKEDWEYEPVLVREAETNTITVKFQQVPPEHLQKEIFSQAAEMFGSDKTSEDEKKESQDEGKKSQVQRQHQKTLPIKKSPQFGACPTPIVLISIFKKN